MYRNRILRHLLSLLLGLVLILGLPADASAAVVTRSPLDPGEEKTLNVLFIGNSFSVDTTRYMYDIADQAGYRLFIGDAWISGCTLARHVANAQRNTKRYTYLENKKGKWTNPAHNNGYAWRLSWIMQRRNWDVIILQSQSAEAGMIQTFFPGGIQYKTSYLEQLAQYCQKNCPDARIGYNMTWALPMTSDSDSFASYQRNQETMIRRIWSTTRILLGTGPEDSGEENSTRRHPASYSRAPHISFIIPTGTAIQNARTSYMGDTMNRDSRHLSYGIGRYIASMTAVSSLGIPVDGIRKLNLEIAASTLNLDVIKKSVADALDQPFAISSQSTELPSLGRVRTKFITKGRSITIEWSKVRGATAYKIKYLLPGAREPQTVVLDPHKRTYTFTGGRGTNAVKIYALGDAYIPRSRVHTETIRLN